MEQARCWIWPKRKLDLMMTSPHHHHHHHHHLLTYPSANPSSSSNGDSWEEQAFAEDAAGALGGCVWPPRSYTCSFCRREFRSAQALGGHMNVHRRDRARLKQSSPPEGEGGNNSNNHHHHVANPTVPLEAQYTPPRGSSGGTLVYNHSSPDSDHWIRVSSNIQEQYKNTKGLSASWSTLSGFGLTQDAKNGEKKELKVLIDLRKNTAIDEEENNLKILDSSDQDVSSCKRRKIDENPTFDLLSKPGSEILSNPIEELDLELRLGSDPPKVK